MLDWSEELGCRKDNDQMNRDDKMNRRQNTTQKTRGVGVEAMGHLYFPLNGITTPGSGQTLQLLARDRHYNSWLGTYITTPGSEQTQTCYSYLKYTLPSNDNLFLIIAYHTYNTHNQRVYLKSNI
jgi:hypothetical protein